MDNAKIRWHAVKLGLELTTAFVGLPHMSALTNACYIQQQLMGQFHSQTNTRQCACFTLFPNGFAAVPPLSISHINI